MVARGPLDGYLGERARLIAAATPGTAAARALSDLTDEAVSHRVETASSRIREPFALFALGGYGASRLLPGSDIDLLVVSAAPAPALEPLVRELLYPLWDAGLAVGHQVRTHRGQVAAVSEDIQNASGFLTGRLLAGNAGLAAQVTADVFRRIRRDARRMRAQLVGRARPGSPYLLEPDLKEGAGGQRDLDELAWHAAMLAGAPNAGLQPLVDAGALADAESECLADALVTITAGRWVLHRDDPRAGNRLAGDAAALQDIDADALQRALEHVHHTLLAVRERLGRPARAGAMPAARAHSAVTLEELRALAAGAAAAPGTPDAAERAAYEGRFEAVVPGLAELMTLRRPALSHRYTVGAHCLRVLAAADAEVRALGVERVSPALHDATLVAALAHDVGKRLPTPGHPARGAVEAERAARALGLDDASARAARTLAHEHLLLSETIAHADLADEDAILGVAARIGDAALVAPLYALTAADMRSTGPDVWTAWRATLIGDLAAKLETALSPDGDGAGIVEAAEATRDEARRRGASEGASRAVLAFIEGAPLRYLARREPSAVLRDARLVQSVAGPGAPGRFAFGVVPGPADHTWALDVVTRDRPGLFATITGALALAGLSALSAEAHTDRTGIAVDSFVVTSATLAPADTATWNVFERTLGLALSGSLDLDTRLAERRRHYPPTAEALTEVAVVGRTAFSTAVRVRAADRVGLLHDLARALESAGLDIRRATITTLAGVASDVFELTDADGVPPSSEALGERLVGALEAAAS